jgi:uncharacterized protein (TIGR04255 family)
MARPRVLKNKPLAEAILEVRWLLEPGSEPETRRDPHYKFLLGRLFEKIGKDYPHHEELPPALAPEEITPYMVHHRFRAEPGGWPAVQVGPGVFTVNETSGYQWETFEQRINDAVPKLVEAYPKPDALKFETLMLRFINAVPFDSSNSNALTFLSKRMQTSLSIPTQIFESGAVSIAPREMGIHLGFPCATPPGILRLKFNTGTKNKQPALLFELWFVSQASQLPPMPTGFREWASSAHKMIEDTFFALIEGELEREFAGND